MEKKNYKFANQFFKDCLEKAVEGLNEYISIVWYKKIVLKKKKKSIFLGFFESFSLCFGSGVQASPKKAKHWCLEGVKRNNQITKG